MLEVEEKLGFLPGVLSSVKALPANLLELRAELETERYLALLEKGKGKGKTKGKGRGRGKSKA